MLIKRALLATSALAVIAGIGPAQAAGPLYVSVFGGANFQQQNSSHAFSNFASTDVRLDPDTGFLIGAEVGVHLDRWLHGLRAGLEASYRRNNVHGDWFQTSIINEPTGSGGPIDARVSTFAVMANVWYDIDLGNKWRPYIGGGAGWARTHVGGAAVTTFGGEQGTATEFGFDRTGFAWQLGAGVNYEIQDGVSLGLGYRFFRGPSIRNDIFIGKNDAPFNFENESHSVLLSLTIETN